MEIDCDGFVVFGYISLMLILFFFFSFLQCMEEAGVDGALIVQPINHKFDHSYVTRYAHFSTCRTFSHFM